jgi:hypothetical protein
MVFLNIDCFLNVSPVGMETGAARNASAPGMHHAMLI